MEFIIAGLALPLLLISIVVANAIPIAILIFAIKMFKDQKEIKADIESINKKLSKLGE